MGLEEYAAKGYGDKGSDGRSTSEIATLESTFVSHASTI